MVKLSAMTDHNSLEAIAARANQDDPIIMYLIVREILNMSIGKTAAQCAHASQMLLIKYFDYLFIDMDLAHHPLPFSKEDAELFQAWLDGSFRKVVLKADDKEWKKIKDQIVESNRVTVVDAGLTEIEPGSETVIGLIPIRKSNVPRVIKRLQVLK